MNKFQLEVVNQTKGKFAKCEDLESLAKLGSSLICSYTPWLKAATRDAYMKSRARLRGDAKPEKLVVVDVPNLIHKYFAVKPEECVDMFLNKVISWKKKYSPKWMAFAFDYGKQSFRYDLFEEYKSDRESKAEDLKAALKKTYESLCEAGEQVLIKPGYEADDLIATVVTTAMARGEDSLIISSDSDLHQLLTSHVYQLKKGEVYTAAKLEEDYHIKPYQFVDYLVLTGKDCVPHPDGIGVKTAQEFLAKYGSFMGVWNHSDELNKRQKAGIEDFLGNYFKAHKCHSLNRGVEIGFSWNN